MGLVVDRKPQRIARVAQLPRIEAAPRSTLAPTPMVTRRKLAVAWVLAELAPAELAFAERLALEPFNLEDDS